MNTTQPIEQRRFQNYFHQGYSATKQSAVPLSRLKSRLLKICLSRVQEHENVYLYPEVCLKSAFRGYRRAKTSICTLMVS